MLNKLIEITGNRNIRTLWILFGVTGVVHGLTLATLIPFLRALLLDTGSLVTWTITLCTLGALTFVMATALLIWSMRVSVYDVVDLAIDRIGASVAELPLGWFNASSQAKVSSAVSRETNTLSHLSSMVLPAVTDNVAVPATLTIATLMYDWRLGILMLAAVWPLLFVWRKMLATEIIALKQESDAAAVASGRLLEFASLQPLMRATGKARNGWEQLDKALHEEHQKILDALKIKGRPAFAFNSIVQLTFISVMALGLYLVSIGSLDWVGYIAIGAIAARASVPLGVAPMYGSEITNSRVAVDAVHAITDSPRLPEATGEAIVTDTTIVFDNVSFGYQEDMPVLENISLTASSNQMTALVGPSGSGKSTMLRLAARFWDVSAGKVRIGGVDVRDIPTAQLMSMISLVFQDVYLFDTTIRENLQMARTDATDAELEAAAKAARLDKVIETLPDGWDTRVGQGGLLLSGGERQRVAIARAFIKDAPILLLDEVTSALDGENEAAVTEAIQELTAGRTVIVVAHRLTTIRFADQVAVVAPKEPTSQTSTIVEAGTYDDLHQHGGVFTDLLAASSTGTTWTLKGAAQPD
ncbi:MAG: ABC transporter ATP-binding protein [Actinomycetaceae bacterium]|nr:ABC transporter ATP-binding protein [Actinomycetaceae bacterium]